jgi:hypothetical protein
MTDHETPAPETTTRRSRLRQRLTGLPRYVRWPAATVLALLLVLGIGAGGFAVGQELTGHEGGGRGEQGEHGEHGGHHGDHEERSAS